MHLQREPVLDALSPRLTHAPPTGAGRGLVDRRPTGAFSSMEARKKSAGFPIARLVCVMSLASRTVLGFDINARRIHALQAGRDVTLEVSSTQLAAARRLSFTDELADHKVCRTHIVTVPTPIDRYKRPDLTPLIGASTSVGKVLRKCEIVIYESIVYPGCTEEVCVPILERGSGLRFNRDFFVGYSPERIKPGDKEHRLPTIKKVTSGSTPEAAEFVDALYRAIVTVGTHRASSIKIAEAAKVIENTQRDANIALVNELALIFARLGIDTEEVLKAAGSKWNFLHF